MQILQMIKFLQRNVFGLIYSEQLKGKNQVNHLKGFSWRMDRFHWSKQRIQGNVARWLSVEQKFGKLNIQ